MRALASLLFVLVLLSPAQGATLGTIETEHVRAEVIARAATVAPGDTVDLALTHRLASGWHTYWLNPGDSGEPPIVAWSLPDGGTAGELRFPAPQRLAYPPLMNFGFKDAFTLLTSVTVPASWPAGRPYPIELSVDWLVCADICIPEGGKVAFELPTGPETIADSLVAFTFIKAERALPEESDAAATYEREGDAIRLTVAAGSPDGAAFFPYQRDAIDHGAPQPAQTGPNGDVVMTLSPGRGRLDGALAGVLVHDGGALAITAEGPPDPVKPVAVATAETTSGGGIGLAALPSPSAAPGLGTTLLFAFVGGLILNLMPCVFPVLTLKALSLVQHAHAPFVQRAAHGGAYFAGILVSFGVLLTALLVLKAAGVAVGWGFQLQSPEFVAAMALVLFAVGLNLSGVFQIGTGLTRLGAHGGGGGLGGSFATGALATLVATPCTAPFMAVAIGTALAADAAFAAFTFCALALGLAAPFVLLSITPGAARLLPRPGVWMERMKQGLAFPVYATAAWLVWVLAQLIGVEALLPALFALVLVASAAWLLGLSQRGEGRSHKVAAGLSAAVLLLAVAAALPSLRATPQPALAAPVHERYSPARLQELATAGRPVLVNATAAWCITCKVNEQTIFATDRFQDLMTRTDTAYLVADWTRRDPDVTALLDGFDRAGVPLYIYYDRAGAPTVLPQILTFQALEALITNG